VSTISECITTDETYFNLALVAEKKLVWGMMIRNLLDTLTISSTREKYP